MAFAHRIRAAGGLHGITQAPLLIGISTDTPNGNTELQAVTTHETDIGRSVDIVHNYHWWGTPFGNADEVAMTNAGKIILWSWQTNTDGSTGPQWSDIAAGAQDSVIDAQATRVKSMSGSVMINFQNEPESSVGTYGTAVEYAAAWRHIHDRFAAANVTNAIWTFVVMGVTPGTDTDSQATQMHSLYPGDAYVDWIAYDPYNWCAARGDTWKSFSATVGGWYTWATMYLAPTKNYMLAEYGSVEDVVDAGRKAQWFAEATKVMQARVFPQLKALVYFDHVGSGGSGSTPDGWLLHSSTQALAGYRAMVNANYSTVIPLPTLTTEDYEAVGNGNNLTTSNTSATAITIGTGAEVQGDTATSVHGTTAMRVKTSATAAIASSSTSVKASTEVWTRLYFRFSSLPGAETRLLRYMDALSGVSSVRLTPAGKLTIGDADNALVATSTTTLTANTWYRLEFMTLASPTTGQCELKIFSSIDSATPTETLTTAATQNTGLLITDVLHGVVVATASIANWWFDDLAISTTGYPGPYTGP